MFWSHFSSGGDLGSFWFGPEEVYPGGGLEALRWASLLENLLGWQLSMLDLCIMAPSKDSLLCVKGIDSEEVTPLTGALGTIDS